LLSWRNNISLYPSYIIPPQYNTRILRWIGSNKDKRSKNTRTKWKSIQTIKKKRETRNNYWFSWIFQNKICALFGNKYVNFHQILSSFLTRICLTCGIFFIFFDNVFVIIDSFYWWILRIEFCWLNGLNGNFYTIDTLYFRVGYCRWISNTECEFYGFLYRKHVLKIQP
jgi:hypothetical protein